MLTLKPIYTLLIFPPPISIVYAFPLNLAIAWEKLWSMYACIYACIQTNRWMLFLTKPTSVAPNDKIAVRWYTVLWCIPSMYTNNAWIYLIHMHKKGRCWPQSARSYINFLCNRFYFNILVWNGIFRKNSSFYPSETDCWCWLGVKLSYTACTKMIFGLSYAYICFFA